MLQFILLFNLMMLAHGEISSSSDLNCDFSSDCRWRNATDDSGEWMTSSTLEIDPTHTVMPMKEGDEGKFAYSSGFMGRTMTMLVSDVVSCQLGGANIKYWYYQTGEHSQLEVCIRQPPGNKEPNALRCYDGVSSTHAQQWIFRVIELPPASQPFEIVLRAIYYPPTDVIAIDDIIYDAALCEIANQGANQGAGGAFDDLPTSPPRLVEFDGENELSFNRDFENVKRSPTSSYSGGSGTTPVDPAHRPLNFAAPTIEATTTVPPAPRVGPLFNSICPLIDCTFDDNTFCNYVTSKSDATNETLREWTMTARGVLNSVTGIPHDLSKSGTFLYAGGLKASPFETFVLSSKLPFELREPARLDFFIYQAGVRGRLRVCINTLNNCPMEMMGQEIDVDSRKWKNRNVQLSPGTHAVHFVADRLHDNYAIGLDQIQLLNRYGTAAVGC